MILLLSALAITLSSSTAKEVSVYPKILEERTSDGGLVLQLNGNLTLNLLKSSVISDSVYVVTSEENRNTYETIDASGIDKALYHDPEKRSSIRILRRDNALEVEGVIDSKLRIKPLLEEERSSEGQVLHTIYEVEEIKDDLKKLSPKHLRAPQVRPSARNYGGGYWWAQPWWGATTTARPNVQEFVVEVHVVSCKEHQAKFPTNAELIAYMAVMVNAVNMRYLDMSNPRIRYKLVGVTRSKDDVFATGLSGHLDAEKTLRGLATYYSQGYVPGNPDVVYFITNQDLAKIQYGTITEKNVAGLAFVGTVCTKKGVAEGEDIAKSYMGVYCMAHELAHSLGAEHDTTPECPWSHGYLMSYVDGGTNKYKLSRCSERQIRHLIPTLPHNCIKETYNKQYMNDHRRVPGQLLKEVEYCRMMLKKYGHYNPITADKPFHLINKCKMNCCFRAGYRKYCQQTDVLEGMSCLYGKSCRRGLCGNHRWQNK